MLDGKLVQSYTARLRTNDTEHGRTAFTAARLTTREVQDRSRSCPTPPPA